MRVLLDECVPRALRSDIRGHEIKSVAEAGWAGVKNGELRPLMPAVIAAIAQVKPGIVTHVGKE